MNQTRATTILVFLAFTAVVPVVKPLCVLADDDPPRQEDLDALEATIASLQDEEARVRISGTERVRVMNIRSDADSSTGPYGEILRDGNTVRYRLGIKIDATVTPSVTAGGWLRLSNEGRMILTQGPDYLSLERGSAYVRYSGDHLRMTCGYYPIHFTPLTLMRWDLEDNPQGGGSMACAVCGSASGLLSAESLEELGPSFHFEGTRADLSFADACDVVAFYARADLLRRLYVDTDGFYEPATEETSRDIQGFRTIFHAYGPGASRGSAAFTYLRAADDQNTIPGDALDPSPTETELIGTDGEIYPVDGLTLSAEWARTRALRAPGRPTGEAYIAGARTLIRRSVSASIHYIRVGPTFRSPYAALSYLPNRKGVRVTAGWRSGNRKTVATIFYKNLEEILRESGQAGLTSYTTWGFSLRIGPHSNISVEGNLILDLETRDSASEPLFRQDLRKRTVVVDAARAFGAGNEVRIRYQGTRFDDRVFPADNAFTHLTSLLWSVEF